MRKLSLEHSFDSDCFLFRTPAAFENSFVLGQDEVFPSAALQRAEPWTGQMGWGVLGSQKGGMQDAKSLVEPCAWENIACPGEWPGPVHSMRSDTQGSRRTISLCTSLTMTQRVGWIWCLFRYLLKKPRTLSICQFLCFPDIRSFHPGWINPYSIIVIPLQ